jgi:hypothetical protein
MDSELGQNNDSQRRHRICNERQSLAIAMYRTVEYENKKKYFWNSVALLCLALQIWWRHWEYRHMACGAVFGSGIHIKRDSTYFCP